MSFYFNICQLLPFCLVVIICMAVNVHYQCPSAIDENYTSGCYIRSHVGQSLNFCDHRHVCICTLTVVL